jgi:two-component system, NtrC family, sensor kinase
VFLRSVVPEETMSDVQHRILIADDHEETRYVLGRILGASGYSCSEAATGSQALELAETMPDLLILDVRLPDMSGFTVCQKLKNNPRLASIPVLLISAAFVATEDRVRALDAGADGYMTHPIDRTVLAATVRSLLRMHNAEQLALRSAEEWASTFDALSEGLAILDEDNGLVRWNSAFQSIFAEMITPATGKDVSDLLASLGVVHKKNEKCTTEICVNSRSMELSIGPIPSSGLKNESIMIVSDITDRKLAEYAARTAEQLAATGKLANAIAHEINNPLEALINLIYLARSSPAIDYVKDILERADEELGRIARITKQTLAFHRDTQHPIAVDVCQLLAEVISLYERTSSAKGVRFVIDAKPVPPIVGHPGQLSQVFANLVRNATEASPPDSTVNVRARHIHRCGRAEVRVTIHDRGNGIPVAVRPKIFDPFFTTKGLKGSGLGLWVSRSLIAKHNGAIRFRTSERAGQTGTTFAVFLPISEENAA